MNEPKEHIPLFKSWTGWYLMVIGFLVVLIGVCYWLTHYFS